MRLDSLTSDTVVRTDVLIHSSIFITVGSLVPHNEEISFSDTVCQCGGSEEECEQASECVSAGCVYVCVSWQCHRHGEFALGLAVRKAYLYLAHTVFITQGQRLCVCVCVCARALDTVPESCCNVKRL